MTESADSSLTLEFILVLLIDCFIDGDFSLAGVAEVPLLFTKAF